MQRLECTTEQARAYVAERHSDGLELPRVFWFGGVDRHLPAAVIYAALGRPDQIHDIGSLYVCFSTFDPPFRNRYDWNNRVERKVPRSESRARATKYWEEVMREALERQVDKPNETILESVDWIMGAEWKLDDMPVNVFAADSQGIIQSVYHIGNFVGPGDRNWPDILGRIQNSITDAFGPDS